MADTLLQQLAKTDRNPIQEEQYQNLLKQGGTAGVDLSQISNLTAQQRAGTSNLLAGQNTLSADYLKRYTDFLGSQEGASAMAGRIGGELGIPALQANATMLRNTMTNLPSTYSKATTGYDVNANQLARIIGQKSSELAPALSTAETSLAGAQNILGQRMGYEQADQAKALLPWQTEQTMLADRLARETSLFSQQNQRELDSLIAKIQMGITLSEGEKNRAQQLAMAEKEYEYQKQLNQQQIDAQGTGQTDYLTLGEGTAVWDPVTGQMVYKNPKTYQGTSGGVTNTESYFSNTPTLDKYFPNYFTPD